MSTSHPCLHHKPGGQQAAGHLRRHYGGRRLLVVLVQYRRALGQLLESVGGGLYPVYPDDGDQVPFDLVQDPVRADAQRAVGVAEETARGRWTRGEWLRGRGGTL